MKNDEHYRWIFCIGFSTLAEKSLYEPLQVIELIGTSSLKNFEIKELQGEREDSKGLINVWKLGPTHGKSQKKFCFLSTGRYI